MFNEEELKKIEKERDKINERIKKYDKAAEEFKDDPNVSFSTHMLRAKDTKREIDKKIEKRMKEKEEVESIIEKINS